jgi:hypothetical protein
LAYLDVTAEAKANAKTIATTKTKADPYGMTNKKAKQRQQQIRGFWLRQNDGQ